MTPEEKARQNLDRLLTEAGWILQEYPNFNFFAGKEGLIKIT